MGCCISATPKQDVGRRGKASSNSFLVVRVPKAELLKDFDGFGKMDPYAVIKWIEKGGKDWELSRTRVDWNGHFAPTWDHTCPGHPYPGHGKIELEVAVWESNFVGSHTFCGAATIPVDDLLGEKARKAFHPGKKMTRVEMGQLQAFALLLEGETTGHIHVQGMLVPSQGSGVASTESKRTPVDAAKFEAPVSRVEVSGGTAPFFRLKLLQPGPGQSPSHYIGKDLSRALDELDFYEGVLQLKAHAGGGGLGPLIKFMFDYAGIASCKVEDAKEDDPPKDLLVLRNLFDGCEKLRLMDIKIGQKTSQAGWQGKSRIASLRQNVIDGLTNSAAEGFRLEGFDGRPPALKSMDPLLDFGMDSTGGKIGKKALRFMFQQMKGADMFTHLLDVHQEPADPGQEALATVLAPPEYIEIMLHESVVRLASLCVACYHSPVPQKWIGSSVAIGFDCGNLPSRSTPEADIRNTLRLNIFDWGRSELNTIEKHGKLSEKDMEDRQEFWRFYVGGIRRLAWRASTMYHNHFGNCVGWSEVILKIVDFDSASENDFVGMVLVPLTGPEVNGKEVTKTTKGGATITYSIQWRPLPEGSRLTGSWRVRIVRARSLGRMDLNQLRTTSDPMIEVIAVSKSDPPRAFRQFTTVKARNNEPDWDETFDIPVAARTGEVQVALNQACPKLGADPLSEVLPCDYFPQTDADKLDSFRIANEEEKGLAAFGKRVEEGIHTVSFKSSNSMTSNTSQTP
mmetsp:Transcript_100986/g.200623  ORF Transcript_100986/g.200623 Transcript_100986/m.200623 type:complete len:738 (-) Transcript_100986:223-2436(-)